MKKGMSFPPVGVTAEISVIPNEPVSPDPEASGTSWAKVTGVALPRSPRAALLVISKMRTVKKKKKAVNPPPGNHHLLRHLQEQGLEQKRGLLSMHFLVYLFILSKTFSNLSL